jgi:Tol biopolymer transport system component
MTLKPGTNLGHHEILALAGTGGMGEVWRARDTKLKRDVAIKVLPEGFASNPERLARFQREAEVLASLKHPNIATIHGLEEYDGVRAIVMEFVEGPTLADRIRAGPIPLDEALPIAKQIADALETAHEKGVIHRDLKPANVKITPEGTAKVLDFGLAKALEPGEAGGPGGAGGLSNAPTLTSPAMMTGAGMILGTAAYMSPEQARGKTVDKRCDIWSFGVVLFELFTGRQVFIGEEVSDILAAVLRAEPDWNALPRNTPASIRTLLRRCLERDPKERLRDMGEARIAIQRYLADPAASPVATVAPEPRRKYWKAASVLFFVTTTALAVAAAFLYWKEPERNVVRFAVSLPEKTILNSGLASVGGDVGAVVSPDGRNLAFTARDASGKTRLWVQPIDSLTAKVVPDTDEADLPFWSPDSRFIAFSSLGKLKRVDVNGGPVQTICNQANTAFSVGGTWNSEGVILFSSGPRSPLYRVAAAGGQPVAITKLLEGQSGHRFPWFLPDGRHFVYFAVGSAENSGVLAGDLQSGATKRLFAADTGAVYVPPDFLLFIRQGILLAQEFDAKKLETIGDPKPVAEQVVYSTAGPTLGAFSASTNGVLTYRTGAARGGGGLLRLTWVDRTGKELEQIGQPGPYRGVELSPDGKRLAVHRHEGNGGDVWVFEPPRTTPLRLTFDASQDNSSPIWSADGKRIVFGSLRAGMWGLYQKPADGAGDEELLYQAKMPIMPTSWSQDGQFLVFWLVDPKTGWDLWVLPLKGDKKPQPFLQSAFNESTGQISPDGKWISYSSNESGQFEIYVRPFPSGSGRWQVSTDGGFFSQWRPDGKEIFYQTTVSRGKVMAVEVKTSGPTFEYGAARELFDSQYVNVEHAGGNYHSYAVSRDGQRFLIPRPVAAPSDTSATSFTVVLNWPSLLKK